MPVTTSVNKMTVVHKGSTGISQAFPDVCKTPAPPAPPLPIPYPNIAMSSDTADGSTTVKVDGNPIMLSTSKYAMSTGDEAGSLFGVVSNKVKGSANPQSWSMDVKVDGKNVFRQLDLMLHNGGSKPTNTPPGPNLQPPLPPATAGAGPGKNPKVTDVQWSHTKLKCGDLVKVNTKTSDYTDGMPLLHIVHKNGSKRVHEMFQGSVTGNKVEIDSITRNGAWKKKPTKLKVKAHGIGGVKESGNELEIEIPPETTVPVQVGWAQNRVEKMEKVVVPKTILGIPIPFTKKEVIRGAGKFVAWDYGYDLTIKQGVFQVHHKTTLVPQVGVKLGKLRRSKRAWKREIENTWDRKWKEHRAACQRGDKCDCPTGCCIFPLRVKCTFVAGGGHVTVNVWPGSPTYYNPVGNNPDWWNSGNWYERTGKLEGNASVVHAHEFGHTIGMADEYEGGSVSAKYFNIANSLMQSGTQVMKQHIDEHPFNGVSIHAHFQKAVGGGYKLLPM